MNRLKNQIRALEMNLEINRQMLQCYEAELRQRLAAPKIISTALCGGLLFGFLLGHKKTSITVSNTLHAASGWMKKWALPLRMARYFFL